MGLAIWNDERGLECQVVDLRREGYCYWDWMCGGRRVSGVGGIGDGGGEVEGIISWCCLVESAEGCVCLIGASGNGVALPVNCAVG